MAGRLFERIDIAPLVFFRVVGGGLITIETIGAALTEYHRSFVDPEAHFSYLLLPWLRPWPPVGVHAHFAFNALMALCVTLGFHYRLAAALLFLGSSSLFLMERGVFINHLYLYCLVSLLLAFVPAHRALSLDARRDPALRASWAPAWTLHLLRFQVGVVYVWAAIAKMHPDWWEGWAMRDWLSSRAEFPVLGPLFASAWLPVLLSRGGLLFDLLVVPGLLWRRTRAATFAVAVAFHLTNVALFGLGTFPWFSIAMTALFFPPGSFRRLPVLRRALPPFEEPPAGPAPRRALVTTLLALYAAVQVLVPARQFLYPGDTNWTEDGHQFAWRMMLRSKAGHVVYEVTDASGRTWREDPRDYVTPWQYRKLLGNADMILELAHFVAERAARRGHGEVEVRVETQLSLNLRPPQPLIDPAVDLARERRRLGPYPWVVPLAPR